VLQAAVHFIHRAKYVSLGLVGDLVQDRSLCFIGLSKREPTISHSAGLVLGRHRWHLVRPLLRPNYAPLRTKRTIPFDQQGTYFGFVR
jgi:hypothetical protein